MFLQTTFTPSWKWCFLVAVASFSRIMHPSTLQKLLRNGLRNITKSIRCVALASQFSWSQSDGAPMGCAGTPNLIHGGPVSQRPGARHYRMRPEFLWSQCLDTSELFRRHEGVLQADGFNGVADQCSLALAFHCNQPMHVESLFVGYEWISALSHIFLAIFSQTLNIYVLESSAS